MGKRFIHYGFHWQLRLTRRQECGGGQQKEKDGNEKVSWVEQRWEGGATLFRFCLCVQMYRCPSKTQAGINSLHFIGNFVETRSFFRRAGLGFVHRKAHTHPHTNSPSPGGFLWSAEDFSLAWFGSDIFNIGRDPSGSLHYLLGSVWIGSSFLRMNPFSRGRAEAGEAKGGQRSVTGCLGSANKSGGVA